MVNVTLILAVFLIVGFIVYSQVMRAASRADMIEEVPNNAKYLSFCDILDSEILALQNLELKDESQRDEALDEIANLSKELVFIQTMHKNNQSPEIWEEKLFKFLQKCEGVILKYAKDGEKIADNWREKLGSEFAKLV
ncbi:hypothetical protein OFN95_02605 [Campylobacter sp. VBCF_02 NA5]|uniref:hypothetical protein n=1 Tax=Campylobacter sp. VBCF_02 NA5 TaxID=2983834 RepID=UPI0022E9B6E3|nr:hypothetical protein [Campylobacter sp. VBCF_02 NA5]MDA3060460.1 hypothetical protein [Campylobacter sp. VBCF_02 NA5]